MKKRILGVLLPILFLFSGCSQGAESQTVLTLADVPAFSGEPYVVIDDNEPHFPEADFTSKSFEQYSELDALGRCGRLMQMSESKPCRQKREAISVRSSQPGGKVSNTIL